MAPCSSQRAKHEKPEPDKSGSGWKFLGECARLIRLLHLHAVAAENFRHKVLGVQFQLLQLHFLNLFVL